MERLCYGCFETLYGNESICPHCGYHLHENTDSPHILRPGTVLNQKYTVGKTLGEGGFGITYLAWDNNMQTKIAIKEFYPASLVTRDAANESSTQIYTITKAYSNEFHAGLERFVKEASILSKFFKLQGIVSVKDFFYENGTAYIVMEYIEGITLKEYLKKRGGSLPVEETLGLMKPVMESLDVVHKQKLLHRDISPDNLMVSTDFQVKLIDFGSARYYDTQSDKSMTVVLKHGYAPIEQYSSSGNQGAWTDVYSLCAAMYRMITGRVPDESINRLGNDTLVSVRAVSKKIPKHIGAAIDKGLSVMPENRQQSVEELYHELFISRRDLRLEKRARIYQNINKILFRLIALIILLIAVVAAAFIKRDTLREFRHRIATAFFADEIDSEDGNSGAENHAAGEQDVPQKDDDTKTAEEEDTEKVDTEKEDTEDTIQDREPATEPADTAAAMTDGTESDREAPPEQPASAQTDAGTQSYQTMRSDLESGSESDDAIIKVRNGKLNNVAAGYTVGEILDAYSETEGVWYAYTDENTQQKYVYYEGSKNGSSFLFEFEVFTNDTFKLTGAMQDDMVVERYADFFQSILTALGL